MRNRKRILIADDDERILLILRATLKRMHDDFQIVAVSDGAKALAEFKRRSFDLVITDVVMPGLNGIGLARSIREINAQTALIWITAYGCHRLLEERDGLAVFCCLNKPLRIGEIRQAVQEAIQNKGDVVESNT